MKEGRDRRSGADVPRTFREDVFKAILFDLDGTLLPMDTDQFFERYFRLLIPRFAQLLEPKVFYQKVVEATGAMINNLDPALTNEAVFDATFYPSVGLGPEVLKPMFMDFYRGEFRQLRSVAATTELSRAIVQKAVEKGMEIILATNPVFPLIAIEERMRWAGIHEFPWRLITSYERMHFCKPHLEYYQEILDLGNLEPSHCLMVGNDLEEDVVAGRLGMKTYLVTDFLIQRGNSLRPDYSGSLADLFAFVESLPAVGR